MRKNFKSISIGLLCVFLVVALLAGSAGTALADEPSYVARFVIGQKTYEVGNEVRQMDVAPFIENGRTFVPVRFLAYAIGIPESGVFWDGSTRTVRLEGKGITLILHIGNKVLLRNGDPVGMDVAPFIRWNRTFLPARFVAEAFGFEVDWDPVARAVLIFAPEQENGQEPGQEPGQGAGQEPGQGTGQGSIPGGKIDWEAAMNGTLQPPAGAIAPPSKWGFEPQAVRVEFKVGSRYAKVTRPDGSTYQLDLGTPCVIAGNPTGIEFLKEHYPDIYNDTNSIPLLGANYGAFYVPFIPVAEAFGVPRENIVWDGEHLVVFGFDGSTRGYIALRAGSKETIWRWVTTTDETIYSSNELDYPLFVKDGVPMLGINSVDDMSFVLFIGPDAAIPAMINAYDKFEGGWAYEIGTAAMNCEPRV
jgi:hypothetical protein